MPMPGEQFVALRSWAEIALETFLVEPNIVFRLRSLCFETSWMLNARTSLYMWLWSHERGRGRAKEIVPTYSQYYAAHLMRLFLRRVLLQNKDVVIAGGYPAAMYAESQNMVTWRPNDVDIFVFNDDLMITLEGLYRDMVASPLGRDLRQRKWRKYKSWDAVSTFEEKSSDEDALKDDKRRRNGDPSNVDSRSALVERIGLWLETQPKERKVTSAWKQVEVVSQHLPVQLRPQQYRVLNTMHLSLEHNAWFATLPINLIRVESEVRPFPEDLPAFICGNFDIRLCCVALTRIADNLIFSEFREFNNAFTALKSRTLSLTTCAFSCQRTSVSYQMHRLAKYAQRGYSW